MDIVFSKLGIFRCVFFMFGCLLLIEGLIDQNRYYNSKHFSYINSSSWKYGGYISDDITSIVKDEEYNRGQSAELDSYSEYTVPVGNNQYVRLYINNPQTKALLEEALEQDSFSIPFTGVISSSPYSINYTFYENAGILDKEQIITEFVIKQTSHGKINKSLIMGFVIVVVSVILWGMGIMPPIMKIEEAIVIPPQKRYAGSCNYEVEIEAQKLLITKLETRMEKLQKEYHQSLLLLPVGIIPIVIFTIFLGLMSRNMYAVVLVLIYYILTLFGICVLTIALVGIYRYQIHTPGKLGILLRTNKSITPIPEQIANCKANIKYMEEKITHASEMTPIYSDKTYDDYVKEQFY